ncbi:MAG TPA: hypothetical protein VKC60_12515 [Opitutaceae bacterium]|nr:hypothetical protein [Opitutaceae bacterium]
MKRFWLVIPLLLIARSSLGDVSYTDSNDTSMIVTYLAHSHIDWFLYDEYDDSYTLEPDFSQDSVDYLQAFVSPGETFFYQDGVISSAYYDSSHEVDGVTYNYYQVIFYSEESEFIDATPYSSDSSD